MKSKIIKSKEYKKAKKSCQRNLTREYNHQVIGYALSSLQKTHGDLAIALLVSEVPEINQVVVIPEYILNIEVN